MGLSVANITLLRLTRLKADFECGIQGLNNQKMAMTRETNKLSAEYNRRLSAKNVSYYANGKYNKVTCNYFTGYGNDILAITEGTKPLKTNNNMVLSDYNGRVIMPDIYANAIRAVCGDSIMNTSGVGGTFSQSKIAEIIAQLIPYSVSEIENGCSSMGYTTHNENTIYRYSTGTGTGDSSDYLNSKLSQLIDFYFPIFQAAAANGWTTEYNTQIANDPENYVSEAITSGFFRIQEANFAGQYNEQATLQYFITAGYVDQRSDAKEREEITAWYDEQKADIEYEEGCLDTRIKDLSTQLEITKTRIEAIQKIIDDAMKIFDFGKA